MTTYQLEHKKEAAANPLSRVATARLHKQKNHSRQKKIILILIYAIGIFAFEYYYRDWFPRETMPILFFIMAVLRSILTLSFWFYVFSFFQKKE